MPVCIVCGKTAFSQYCMQHKPRKAMKASTGLKTNKRINTIGPVTKRWLETRAEWIRLNPGPWVCHYCPTKLDTQTLTLDHLYSRSLRPDLRFELSNLVPACSFHNTDKSSTPHDKYPHKCYGFPALPNPPAPLS